MFWPGGRGRVARGIRRHGGAGDGGGGGFSGRHDPACLPRSAPSEPGSSRRSSPPIVGASFVICVQFLAILSVGAVSRIEFFSSDDGRQSCPRERQHCLAAGLCRRRGLAGPRRSSWLSRRSMLAGAIRFCAPRFGTLALATAAIAEGSPPAPVAVRLWPVRLSAVGLPPEIAGARAAQQGMGAAASRSLADVAKPDADPLPAAAVLHAVADLLRRQRRRDSLLVPVLIMAAGNWREASPGSPSRARTRRI